MNFLAHLYLSGEDEKLLTGNFIGDFVKGKSFAGYPEKMQEGILLHRHIDSFTDAHNRFREVKKLFRAEFGHHAGVVTDLIFDHLLAKNWNHYSHLPLPQFIRQTHATLMAHFSYLPPRVQYFLPILIKKRRLESYARPEGIHHVIETMARHTSLPDKAQQAMEIMQQNNLFITNHFESFMNELIAFVESEIKIQIKRP